MPTRLLCIVCFILSSLFSVSLACASDLKASYSHFNPPIDKLIKSYKKNYRAAAIRLTHSEYAATTSKRSFMIKTANQLFYKNIVTQIASDVVFRPEKSYLGLGWGNNTAANNKSQLGVNFDAGLLVTNDTLLTSDIKAAARSFNRNNQMTHHTHSDNTMPTTLPDDLMVLPMFSASISLAF